MGLAIDNLNITPGMGLDEAVLKFEQWFVWLALEKNGFNQSKTAEELKTHRNNLVRRIHKWGWTDKVQESPGKIVSGIHRCNHGYANEGNCPRCRGAVNNA